MRFTKKPNWPTKVQRYSAFTLAEVLITLGIIGVVAALTLPTLITNNQKTQHVTALKKAYTEINQALIKLSSDNDCVGDLQCTGFFDGDDPEVNTSTFASEFKKYFKISKDCGKVGTDSQAPEHECFTTSYSDYYNRDSHSGDMNVAMQPDYGFITLDGIVIGFSAYQPGCTASNAYLNQICGQLDLDVNGPKKGPNRFGRDLFSFFILNKGPYLYPFADRDLFSAVGGNWQAACSENSGYIPVACAGKIIDEGWKMNY